MSDGKLSFNQAMLNCCFNYTNQIGQLFEYYRISFEALSKHYEKTKNENKISFRILELFNEVYECKTPEEQKAKFEEIKDAKINSKYKLKDLFSDLSFNDKDIGFDYLFNSNIKDYENYFPSRARTLNTYNMYMVKTLKSSILSSLISTFESFLSCVYHNVIYRHPTLYLESKTVSLQRMLKESVESIFAKETEDIVESEMYDSLKTLKKIFEKEEIETNFLKPVLDVFYETYFRRNIYVHNNGRVNKKYKESVPISKYKIDEQLECDEQYVKASATNIQKLMFYLVFKCIEKEGIVDEDVGQINDFYYKKLVYKEYDLTSFANRVISSSKKLAFADKMIAEVNYLISLKELGQKDDFEREMSGFDVSAAEERFKIAKYVLQDKFDAAASLIEETYDVDNTPFELLNWPLYMNFRNTDYYKEIVQKHQDDFVLVELSGDDKEC